MGMAPTTGRESMAEAAANAGITQRTPKCALSRFLSSLCGSHRFKNLQVEEAEALSTARAFVSLSFKLLFLLPALPSNYSNISLLMRAPDA